MCINAVAPAWVRVRHWSAPADSNLQLGGDGDTDKASSLPLMTSWDNPLSLLEEKLLLTQSTSTLEPRYPDVQSEFLHCATTVPDRDHLASSKTTTTTTCVSPKFSHAPANFGEKNLTPATSISPAPDESASANEALGHQATSEMSEDCAVSSPPVPDHQFDRGRRTVSVSANKHNIENMNKSAEYVLMKRTKRLCPSKTVDDCSSSSILSSYREWLVWRFSENVLKPPSSSVFEGCLKWSDMWIGRKGYSRSRQLISTAIMFSALMLLCPTVESKSEYFLIHSADPQSQPVRSLFSHMVSVSPNLTKQKFQMRIVLLRKCGSGRGDNY